MSDKDIKKAMENKELEITNFSEKCLQAASYDFRIGKEGISSTLSKKINIEETGFITVEPAEFAVIMSLEVFKLNNQIVGLIGMKSGYARKGLILLAGIQIDPGFHGHLVIGLFNSGPRKLVLGYKEEIGTVQFSKLLTPALKPYSGKYQDQITIPVEDIEFILTTEEMTIGNVIKSIKMLTKSVSEISNSMTGLKDLFHEHERHVESTIQHLGIIFTVIMAVFATVVMLLLAFKPVI
ncbi:MAG: dCTP deaminase [Candidatus Hodarchaeota archaeon]